MTRPRANPFGLRGPCADCPFRSDKPFHLGPGRRQEIADGLRAGADFPCHKTIDYTAHEDEGRGQRTPGTQWCGGALATIERGDEGPNQSMRIGERLGLYDPSRIDPDAPVHDGLDEWVAADPGRDRG